MKDYVNKLAAAIAKEPFYAAAVIILILSFSFDILTTAPVGTFKTFQSDAEALVLNSYECQQRLGEGAYSGLLLQNMNSNCSKAGPYYSQSGLPFWAMGIFYPTAHKLQTFYIYVIKLLWATLTALILTMIVSRLTTNLRQGYKVLVIALLSVSPWLVLFSHNLYWLMPLYFLPVWFGLMFYDRFQNRLTWFYVLLGLTCAIKFLAGYEFISDVAVAALCPILWSELRHKNPWRVIYRRLSYGLAAAVAAFVLAFGINVAQAAHETGASLAIKTIYGQVRARSFGAVAGVDTGRGIIQELQVLKPVDYEYINATFHLTRFEGNTIPDKVVQNLVVLYQYMASFAINWPIDWRFPFDVILSSIGTFVIFTLVLGIKAWKKRDADFAYNDPLLAMTLFALLGAFSWFMLGYKFSIIHTHLESILFYLPFLPFAYILFANWLQRRFSK